MAKLACEEAADMLLDDYMPALTHKLENERRKPRIELQGRLRAEGRELKRLRKRIVAAVFGGEADAWGKLYDEAAHIQRNHGK